MNLYTVLNIHLNSKLNFLEHSKNKSVFVLDLFLSSELIFIFSLHAGLVFLVLIFLSCAYVSTESQSDTIAAEKLVGFHKKLQQVNDFEPVRFLPVKYVLVLFNFINFYVCVFIL